MSTHVIQLNYWSNWACAIALWFNLAWLLEMCLNGLIQRKELSAYVQKSNWKTPLIISMILGITALVVVYLPGLGITSYVIAIFALAVQAFFMSDYRKTLVLEIQDSWYLTSTRISFWITVLSALVTLVFAISTIAVTDY
ncbi:hypothetical protein FOD75_10760 (plasmid) [Limosilactobacillus reuteri]|uniref:DUF2269 family protein n=1 Tax=Limosilactobacillus reuteri TaxID=1598 RepID=A0A517D887_LIMRT|nr:hypothetical protein [Limosilactobacillus reuteri]QDR73572.1 hypothetical protein FOD75_10760 [Limosilactobacillus reuteri]